MGVMPDDIKGALALKVFYYPAAAKLCFQIDLSR
jgi:hypothetical protein